MVEPTDAILAERQTERQKAYCFEMGPIRQWDVAGEYRLRVKKAFDRLGIEIPFPHRTIYWGTGEPNVLLFKQMQEQLRQETRATPAAGSSRPPIDKVGLPDAKAE